MKGHTALSPPAFNGLYVRGKKENAPSDHFCDCLNIKLGNNQIETREGIELDIAFPAARQIYVYRRTGEASRYLILNNSGQLYDSTNTITPIATIVGMTDFSAVTQFNRVYWTPHNGVKGLPGEKIHVYDGTVDRIAGGAGPLESPAMTAVEGVAGKVEKGMHAYAFCFETATGFITKPGGYVKLDSAGEKKVDLSGVLVGPTGTIARHIIATEILDDFKDDFKNQEYFFVPDGTINDNTTTTITISFYDADLLESADYLLDQMSTIPAGVGIAMFDDRLISWGEDLEPNIVRGSYPGEPEAFDEGEGYLSLNPNDGGGTIKNTFIHRSVLYILKEYRAYATTDNGENMAAWSVDKIDGFLGAYPHSIGNLVEDSEHVLYDRSIIANAAGLWLFNGVWPENPLTWKIQDLWDRINKNAFHHVQVVIDPYNDLIFINVPLDAATENDTLLVMDFENGLGHEAARWTVWTFPFKPTAIFLDINHQSKRSIFKFGSLDNNIYRQERDRRNDADNVIPCNVRFSYAAEAEGENHFGGLRVRAVGVGNLDIQVFDLDDLNSISPTLLTLPGTTPYPLQRSFNFTTWRASVRISVDNTNEWFKINQAIVYARLDAEERPEL